MFKTVVIAVLASASLAIAGPDAGTDKGKAKAEKTADAKEVKTASRLGYTEHRAGKGPSPTATDMSHQESAQARTPRVAHVCA